MDDDENVKLTDFGLSMLLQAVSSQANVASKGTARWAAPELSRSDSPVDSTASIVDYQRIPKDALCPVDIYSFACTVVEVSHHHFHFYSSNDLPRSYTVDEIHSFLGSAGWHQTTLSRPKL